MRKTGIKATKNNIILTFSMEKQRKNPKPIKFTDSELNFIIQKAKEKNTNFTDYCKEKILHEYKLEQYIEQASISLYKLISYFKKLKNPLTKTNLNRIPKKIILEARNANQNFLFFKMLSAKRKFLDLEQKILKKINEQQKQIISKNLKTNNPDDKEIFYKWLIEILKKNIEN